VRAHRSIAALGLAIALGCGRQRDRDIGPAPEKSITRTAPTASASASIAPLVDGLVGYAGEDVSLDGELIVAKHEHIDEKLPGKIPFCMSLASRGEVMVYFDTVPTCPRVRVAGHAFVLRGFTPKTHAAYAEVALDAASWACR
jgi:hypothetical protein